MKPSPTEPVFLAERPVAAVTATQDYLVYLARRSAPEEHQLERLSARNEAHAREMATYLFADSVVLHIRLERRRAPTAFPDARFIKGEFLPTAAEAELSMAIGAD